MEKGEGLGEVGLVGGGLVWVQLGVKWGMELGEVWMVVFVLRVFYVLRGFRRYSLRKLSKLGTFRGFHPIVLGLDMCF